MTQSVTPNIAIFGGGIAGLWLLHRLRQAGYEACLFETNTLGGGQSGRSQGIIHGGMKYALQGVLTNEAKLMADLPALWQQCLQGQGEVDLSSVRVLSQQQYLFAPNKLTATLGGWFAGAALNSQVARVKKEDYPEVFKHPKFKGEVFALDEIVIDVPAVIAVFAEMYRDVIFKIDALSATDFHWDAQQKLSAITIRSEGNVVNLQANEFIFTAGEGNEVAINALNNISVHPEEARSAVSKGKGAADLHSIAMQRRPLHMVMVKTPFQLPLYAHCLGMGPRPRMTITTHYLQDGSAVWYLGGSIAEEGVNRDSQAQITAAKSELNSLFPWLDFEAAEFSTFMIDRAEPLQKSGLKPESCFHHRINNLVIAWPTKLAFAPKLAAEILNAVRPEEARSAVSKGALRDGCSAASSGRTELALGRTELESWPKPPILTPAWEEAFCKHPA